MSTGLVLAALNAAEERAEAAEAQLREASLPSSEDVQMIFRLAKMTERAEAAEAQRDTLAEALRFIAEAAADDSPIQRAARAALAAVGPPERQP